MCRSQCKHNEDRIDGPLAPMFLSTRCVAKESRRDTGKLVYRGDAHLPDGLLVTITKKMLKPEVFSYATYYGALAWLGYYLLWTAALRHGARAAMVAVKRTNRFPDGTPLIQRYTPIAALDRQLISAVIFYHGLLDGTDPAHGLLLVDVHSTMQATALCIMAQTRASLPFTASLLWVKQHVLLDSHHLLTGSLRIPTVWGIVNQFYGAAFVYPLYLLCQTV